MKATALVLLAAFLPYTATVMGHYPDSPLAALLFGSSLIVSWAITGYWALTLLFVWWTPWVQIPWFLTGLVGSDVHRD